MLRVKTLAGFLIVALCLLIGVGWKRNEASIVKPLWDYRVIEFNGSSTTPASDAEIALNKAGADGWELVGTSSSESNPKVRYFYLKRSR
jgi:hypothetical protein